MSTPDAPSNPPHNPFGLLKAILIGSALGFFAVLAAPYVLPHGEQGLRAAAGLQAARVKVSGAAASRRNGVKPASAQEGKDAEAKPPKDSAKSEPVLVPAVTLTFPKTFTSEEMTEALQPLLSFKIDESDAAAIKAVISSVSKGDDAGARAAVKKISDPAARNFAEWRRLRSSPADFAEAMEFRKAHPLFPEPVQEPGVEKSLFLSDASSADVLKFYTNRNPATGAGKASLGGALMETGERERGLRLIKFAWSRYTLDPAVQERFLSRFGPLLDEQDQRRRQLLVEARERAQDDPGKKLASASEGKGLKGAARLRSKREGAVAAHAGHRGKKAKVVHRGRGRRHGDLRTPLAGKEAALSGKARALRSQASLSWRRRKRKAKPIALPPTQKPRMRRKTEIQLRRTGRATSRRSRRSPPGRPARRTSKRRTRKRRSLRKRLKRKRRKTLSSSPRKRQAAPPRCSRG